MADEKEKDLDTARTPDQRMQYGEIRRREKEGAGRSGPSPYDEAPEDAPDDRVITKGEREKPGPTETHAGTDTGSRGERGRSSEAGAGMGAGGMSGSPEEEEALEANEDSGTLGGDALHRRLNDEAVREDMLGDEESP